jgi:monothiol glutaredoxin
MLFPKQLSNNYFMYLCSIYNTRKNRSNKLEVLEKIQKQVDSAAIVIYMKGTPQFPQCGFSARASQTLASTGVEFAYVNIFEDQEVFQSLPDFADWPTFPQIYFNSELVGGGDIIIEMAEQDSLKDAMQEAVEKYNS